MSARRLLLPWARRGEQVAPVREAPPAPAPLPRPSALRHEWLDVTVARAAPRGLQPAPGARLVVRPWPPGEPRPLEPVARALADVAGKASFHLPVGRYSLHAAHAGQAKAVALTLERAGRATLLLDAAPPLHLLAVEVADADGFPVPGCDVEARRAASGEVQAVARTDARGVAHLALPPGPSEVRAADTCLLVEVDGDARLRLAPHAPPAERVTF